MDGCCIDDFFRVFWPHQITSQSSAIVTGHDNIRPETTFHLVIVKSKVQTKLDLILKVVQLAFLTEIWIWMGKRETQEFEKLKLMNQEIYKMRCKLRIISWMIFLTASTLDKTQF